MLAHLELQEAQKRFDVIKDLGTVQHTANLQDSKEKNIPLERQVGTADTCN